MNEGDSSENSAGKRDTGAESSKATKRSEDDAEFRSNRLYDEGDKNHLE